MATMHLHLSSYYMPKVYPHEINVVGGVAILVIVPSFFVAHIRPALPGKSLQFRCLFIPVHNMDIT